MLILNNTKIIKQKLNIVKKQKIHLTVKCFVNTVAVVGAIVKEGVKESVEIAAKASEKGPNTTESIIPKDLQPIDSIDVVSEYKTDSAKTYYTVTKEDNTKDPKTQEQMNEMHKQNYTTSATIQKAIDHLPQQTTPNTTAQAPGQKQENPSTGENTVDNKKPFTFATPIIMQPSIVPGIAVGITLGIQAKVIDKKTEICEKTLEEEQEEDRRKEEENRRSEEERQKEEQKRKEEEQKKQKEEEEKKQKEEEKVKDALIAKIIEENMPIHKKNFNSALEDINKLGTFKKEDNDDNIKPSEIPEIKKIFKTQSGKEYTTEITSATTAQDITDKMVIEEMQKRELITADPGNTSTTIKIHDGTKVIIGTPKNNVKLTPLGQAYSSKEMAAKNNNDEKLTGPFEEVADFAALKIITPPPSTEQTFIKGGLQKHLLVIIDGAGNYLATHYLTSKNTAIILQEKQLKIFQNEQEYPEQSFKNSKAQGIVELPTPLLINKEDVFRVYMDQKYLDATPIKLKQIIMKAINEKIKGPYYAFNYNGLTKQDCIDMCIEHDKIIEKKGKHPLTDDQIKQNEQNKKDQKDKNQNKQPIKDKNSYV